MCKMCLAAARTRHHISHIMHLPTILHYSWDACNIRKYSYFLFEPKSRIIPVFIPVLYTGIFCVFCHFFGSRKLSYPRIIPV